MLEDDLVAVHCDQCDAVLGVFVRADFAYWLPQIVTHCHTCELIEEAERITKEAAAC